MLSNQKFCGNLNVEGISEINFNIIYFFLLNYIMCGRVHTHVRMGGCTRLSAYTYHVVHVEVRG